MKKVVFLTCCAALLYSCKKDEETKATTVTNHTLSFSVQSLTADQSAAGDTASFNIIYSDGTGEHVATSAYGVTTWETDTMHLDPTLYSVFITANTIYPHDTAASNFVFLSIKLDGESIARTIMSMKTTTAVTLESRINN